MILCFHWEVLDYALKQESDHAQRCNLVKFRYCEKAKVFKKSLFLFWRYYVCNVKIRWKIFSNFVTFSQYLKFIKVAAVARCGLISVRLFSYRVYRKFFYLSKMLISVSFRVLNLQWTIHILRQQKDWVCEWVKKMASFTVVKGQIISKCLFGVIVWTKNNNEDSKKWLNQKIYYTSYVK